MFTLFALNYPWSFISPSHKYTGMGAVSWSMRDVLSATPPRKDSTPSWAAVNWQYSSHLRVRLCEPICLPFRKLPGFILYGQRELGLVHRCSSRDLALLPSRPLSLLSAPTSVTLPEFWGFSVDTSFGTEHSISRILSDLVTLTRCKSALDAAHCTKELL